MAMKARLSCPAKTAMQSGMAKTHKWLLEFPYRNNYVEPLMGWVGCKNTSYQKKLWFETKELALHYIEKQGLEYEIIEPECSSVYPKRYGEHFKADRVLK